MTALLSGEARNPGLAGGRPEFSHYLTQIDSW